MEKLLSEDKEKMFAAKTKALVRTLGAQGDLISNHNVNERIEMLTLVKVREKTLWPVISYSIIDLTLLDLLEEAACCPGYTEDVLMEDFKNLSGSCGGGSAAAWVDAPAAGLGLAEVSVSAAVDTVDGASSFTLKKKTVDMVKLRESCNNKKIKKKMVDALKLKETEKLMFVYQKVYNTAPITFFSRAEKDGSVSAACKMFFKLSLSGTKNEKMSFIVPKESTLAYGLMEVTTEDGTLGIPPRARKVRRYNRGWWNLCRDGEDDDSCETLQKVNEEVEMKEVILQPLADLPESTRRDLLETLRELLEDGDALPLLEQTLDQGRTECDRPQSQAVSSFMDVLKASDASTSQQDAVHLLVNAMDTLPDHVPALLTACSPETLRVLNRLVDGLKEDGQTKLPESLPPPLQEEGELRWAAELLCSTNQALRELSDGWDRPELPPGVLLEVLILVVRGLGLMRPDADS